MTVPEAARSIIASNSIYLEAIRLGIANYTALAERIKPQIEELIGSKANTNTVVVAIKRFADSLARERLEREHDSHKGGPASRAKLSMMGGILDVDLQMGRDDSLTGLLDKVFGDNSKSYNLFQTGDHSTLLVEDAEDVRDVMSDILGRFEGTLSEGLSKISIAIGPAEQDPYHMLSIVSGMLYNHMIPIRTAFFTGNEIILILNDKDAAKAYDLIRMKIG